MKIRPRSSLDVRSSVTFLIVTIIFLTATAVHSKAQEPSVRIWRDVTGKFSVKAELVGSDSTSVKLRRKDGKVFSVSISKLSDQDQAFLKISTPSATRKAIAKALAGPPLPPAEIELADLRELLPIPVFFDAREFEDIAIEVKTKIELVNGHSSLQEQLDDALDAIKLSWYTTQTVLVITSKKSMRWLASTKFYRFKTAWGVTPNGQRVIDFASVFKRIEEISPESWVVRGGSGTVRALPRHNSFVIQQSPEVHRQLVKALQTQPMPHQYGHPFDSLSVTILLKAAPITDVLAAISEQIDLPIEQSPELIKVRRDLSREQSPIDIKLENVSAKDALDLVLSQVGCTWVEEGKKLIIETKRDAKNALSSQRFLVKPGIIDGPTLMDAIENCVGSDNWEVFGGRGSIQRARPGVYLVQQGQPAMREVEQFMRDLQTIR